MLHIKKIFVVSCCLCLVVLVLLCWYIVEKHVYKVIIAWLSSLVHYILQHFTMRS